MPHKPGGRWSGTWQAYGVPARCRPGSRGTGHAARLDRRMVRAQAGGRARLRGSGGRRQPGARGDPAQHVPPTCTSCSMRGSPGCGQDAALRAAYPQFTDLIVAVVGRAHPGGSGRDRGRPAGCARPRPHALHPGMAAGRFGLPAARRAAVPRHRFADRPAGQDRRCGAVFSGNWRPTRQREGCSAHSA